MIEALKAHAARHALAYVVVVGFGLQAFGTAFYDNFWTLEPPQMRALGWWQVVALILKSLSFAVGIMVGYLIKSPAVNETTTTVTTKEPGNKATI